MRRYTWIYTLSLMVLNLGCSIKSFNFEGLEPDPNRLVTCYVKAPRTNFIESYFGLKINPKTYAPSGFYKHTQTIIIFNETKDTLYSETKMPDIIGLSWKQERHLIYRVKTIKAIFKYTVDSSGVQIDKEAVFNLKKITNRTRGFVLH